MATSTGERPALIDAVKKTGLTNYNTSITDSENTYIEYTKIDKCVVFFAQIVATQTLPADTVNGMFSNMPKSKDWIPFPAYNANDRSVIGYLQIRNDGGMRNFATINGKALCYGVYFTD